MALYGPAIQKLIPPGSNDPGIIAVGMVLHVADSEGDSLWDFFAHRSGGIESHFYIRFTGVVEQYRNTDHEADANLNGNSFLKDGKRLGLLSVETEGLAAGRWTDEQLASLKALMWWVHKTHNVPLQVCPTWQGPGFGWHIMFGSPGPWTPSVKSCPGPNRIEQFKTILVPWLTAGAPIGDDMPQFDDKIPGRKDGATVRDAFDASLDVKAALSDFRTSSRDRDAAQTKLLRSLVSDLPDQVAAAVEAHLPTDGSTITRAMIREAARKGAASGVTDAYRKAFGTDTPATG